MRLVLMLVVLLALGAPVRPSGAQQPGPPRPHPSPLELGAPAPDFALPGATRYGLLRDPVRLSSFRGETVVLAFFFRARTRG